jgi:hypothetical protein
MEQSSEVLHIMIVPGDLKRVGRIFGSFHLNHGFSRAFPCGTQRLLWVLAFGRLVAASVASIPVAGHHTPRIPALRATGDLASGVVRRAHDLNTQAYRRLSPFEQIPSTTTTGWCCPNPLRSSSTWRRSPAA